MKRYKYTTTDVFKKGDKVWVTGIKFYNTGRTKYLIRPTLCTINDVQINSITVDTQNCGYYVPRSYFLDTPETNYYGIEYSINANIAKTKEEAVENFNNRIKEEIESKYDSFLDFERRAKTLLL